MNCNVKKSSTQLMRADENFDMMNIWLHLAESFCNIIDIDVVVMGQRRRDFDVEVARIRRDGQSRTESSL